MFEITDFELKATLESLAIAARHAGEYELWARTFSDRAAFLELTLGETLPLLWKTIKELDKISSKGLFKMDLHGFNFMLGSDGHIIINDPFFSGWDRRED
jgi:hypothetical protein